MVERDISMAELTGGHVHVAHMSARQSLRAVRAGKERGVRVTCEVTPHHFMLTDEALAERGGYDTNLKMNPPLREAADRDAMIEGLRDGIDRRHRDRPRAAPRRREGARVRPRAVRHRRARDRGVARASIGSCTPGVIGLPRLVELLSAESRARARRARRHARRRRTGGHHDPGAGRDGDDSRGGASIEVEEHAVRRLDAQAARVAATIVGGRVVYRECEAAGSRGGLDDDTSRTTCARQALTNLQEFEVLMLDGHFDYGNGFHGRVYLNPHRIFRQPSLIWRFAQDLIDLLPESIVDATDVVAGPVMGGALLAHTIAGLLDGRRSLTHPPRELRAAVGSTPTGGSSLRPFYQSVVRGKRVLLADDVRNTGKTFERGEGGDRAGGRHGHRDRRDLRSPGGDRRSRRAELRAGRVPGAGKLSRSPTARCARPADGRSRTFLTDRPDTVADGSAVDEGRARSALRVVQSIPSPPSIRSRSCAATSVSRTARSSRSSRPGWRSGASRPSMAVDRSRLPGHGTDAGRVRPVLRSERDGEPLRSLVHRWTRGDDFVALLWILRHLIDEHGSLERAFAAGLDPARRRCRAGAGAVLGRAARAIDLRPAYGRAQRDRRASTISSRGPSTGSACKRLNLFLRWMVRQRRRRSRRLDGRSRDASSSCRSTRTRSGWASACV